MQTDVTRRLFTADEFLRMGEAGIFEPEARLELIEGEILEMSPIGPWHMACVNRATELFVTKLSGRAIVSIQNPVRLSEYTEPQPDVALLKRRDDYYKEKRVSWEDAFLVIEVSDTSLSHDRNRKLPLYAKAGVSEIWIEDLQSNSIYVYRNPGPNGYATYLTLHPGDPISPMAFPDVVFKVEDLLG
jgi:Uma2 family endonuclease